MVVGNTLLIKAMSEAFSEYIDTREIEQLFKIEGDLGKVAMKLFKKCNNVNNEEKNYLLSKKDFQFLESLHFKYKV